MIRKKTRPRGRGLFALYIYIENFKKIFLSEIAGTISILLGRNVSLMTMYQDSLTSHGSSKTRPRGRGLFSLYINIEHFKNLLVRNRWKISILLGRKVV